MYSASVLPFDCIGCFAALDLHGSVHSQEVPFRERTGHPSGGAILSINLLFVLGILLVVSPTLGGSIEALNGRQDQVHELLRENRQLQSNRVLAKTFNIPSEIGASGIGIPCVQGVPAFSALHLTPYSSDAFYTGAAGISNSPARSFPICSSGGSSRKQYAEAIVPFTPPDVGWYRIAVSPISDLSFDFAVSVGHCSSSDVLGLQDSGYYSYSDGYVQACSDDAPAGQSEYLLIPMFDRAKYYILIDTVNSNNVASDFLLSITFDHLEAATEDQTMFDLRLPPSSMPLILGLVFGVPAAAAFVIGMASFFGLITCQRQHRKQLEGGGGVVLGTFDSSGAVNGNASPEVIAMAQVVDNTDAFAAVPVAQLA
jgi:hypothetical protein